jgi:hypothetical protein
MGPFERASQRVARVPFEWGAVEVRDVAKDPGYLGVVVVPRQELERLGVRAGQHVGLLHAAEPVNGRAVEGHALVECVLEFGRGDVDSLGGPQHVREPQLDEANAPLLRRPQHIVPLALHRTSFACADTPLFRRRPATPAGHAMTRPADSGSTTGNLERCRTCASLPRS